MSNPEMTGEEFRSLREPLGDIASVSITFGVHRVTMSKWERNKQPIPGPARALVRILSDLQLAKLDRIAELEEQKREILDGKG